MQAHIQKSSHISHLLISSMATGTHLVGQIETFCGPFFFLLFRCRNSLMANTQRKKKPVVFFFLCYLTFPPTNLRRYLVPLEREREKTWTSLHLTKNIHNTKETVVTEAMGAALEAEETNPSSTNRRILYKFPTIQEEEDFFFLHKEKNRRIIFYGGWTHNWIGMNEGKRIVMKSSRAIVKRSARDRYHLQRLYWT